MSRARCSSSIGSREATSDSPKFITHVGIQKSGTHAEKPRPATSSASSRAAAEPAAGAWSGWYLLSGATWPDSHISRTCMRPAIAAACLASAEPASKGTIVALNRQALCTSSQLCRWSAPRRSRS